MSTPQHTLKLSKMTARGERFQVDFSSDEETEHSNLATTRPTAPSPFNFIADIKERNPETTPKPPTLPTIKSSGVTGFPPHRKRTTVSTIKQHRSRQGQETEIDPTSRTDSQRHGVLPNSTNPQRSAIAKADRDSINQENEQRLASMSDREIEEERRELMSGLSPALIERLLKKANIDDDDPERYRQKQALADVSRHPESLPQTSKQQKTVTFLDANPETIRGPNSSAIRVTSTTKTGEVLPALTHDPEAPSIHPPPDLHPSASPAPSLLTPLQPSIHFPTPPKPPPLDPSSPTFLTDLHTHYYPHLPTDPSTQSWLSPLPTPSSAADLSSPYSPALPSLPPSSLRFSFTGALLPPTLARNIPVTEGLHHHGQAPEAAGYTIEELAMLARSMVASQRCIAYQTLGRILFRLGKGEWGSEGDELVMGLWECVKEGKVVERMTEEARKEGAGSLTAKAMAIEALWNWQQGGGRRWKAK